jgi:hypothetical protein
MDSQDKGGVQFCREKNFLEKYVLDSNLMVIKSKNGGAVVAKSKMFFIIAIFNSEFQITKCSGS